MKTMADNKTNVIIDILMDYIVEISDTIICENKEDDSTNLLSMKERCENYDRNAVN